MNPLPPSNPNTTFEVYEPPTSSAPLWNPNAAANWSVLLSPLFGICLHRSNWKAMGEQKEAQKSLVWLTVGILLLVLGFFVDVSSGVWLLFLIGWYFFHAKAQSRYVAETYGTDYERRKWVPAIATAIGILAAYIGVAFLFAYFGPKYLPKADDSTVMTTLDQIIKNSDAFKADPSLTVSAPVELSYDKTVQQRHCRAHLGSSKGTEDLFYRVEWSDNSKTQSRIAIEPSPQSGSKSP